jgi:hypothetical protein
MYPAELYFRNPQVFNLRIGELDAEALELMCCQRILTPCHGGVPILSIICWSCATLFLPGDLLTFADVAESARLFNETALGYISASGNTVLAPEPTHPLNFQQGDRVGERQGLYRTAVGCL